MFASMSNAAAAYGRIGTDMQVETADPHKLILMLFEGAKMSVASASMQYRQGQLTEMSKAISKAIDIIANGLKACLDFKAGGDLSERLAALYDYMCARLQDANLKGNAAAFDEVAHLLGELGSAWEEIANNPRAHPTNQPIA